MSHVARPASIHPTVFVATGAVVLGDVTLRARASVWFNTVIRGDSAPVVVGEDTNLQDNSVVHEDEGLPALIGARVTVGHRAIIHGCVIEDDCLIGMGSVVLSGARIGTGSLVGAASLVREHQSIPAGSLVVGSPARVVGPVSAGHRAAIRNGAAHYAELARFYMTRGLGRGADPAGDVANHRGPMTRREWQDLLERLDEGPAWVAARARPGAPAPAALLELASLDRDLRMRAIDAALREPSPPLMDPSAFARPQGVAAMEPSQAWREARLALCAKLESLGPGEWSRPIGHPTRGAMPLADWVREWVDQDLDLRRDMMRRREGPA